jgi:hypothetical protein
MALSDDKLWDLWNAQGTDDMSRVEAFTFARAIESEVRKQDTELIRQLVEAMEGVKALNMGGELALWTAEFYRLLSAIAAARARMSPPPTA